MMELLNHPGVLVTVALATIGFIGWLIRLESMVNTNREQLAEQKILLNTHRENADIHFNIRVSEQVDRRNEQRFETIEDQLKEINRKLDHIAGRG